MAEVSFEQEWFTGPKMKHPLADPASARVLVARHASGDPASVLKKITHWVQELMTLPEVPLQDCFAVLDLLDAHAKNFQITLGTEYLETARLRKVAEGSLWTTSHDFWTTIGAAYLKCLDRYQAETPPSREVDYILPALVGRIIRSLTLQFKWTLLRHERVDEKLWRDLGRTFLFAESRDFSDRRIAVYASRHGESSAQAELLKILMLAVAGPDGLTPIQLHLAERITAHFGDRFVFSNVPLSGTAFNFDLAAGKAPLRNGVSSPAPLLRRYFGPGQAIEGLHELGAYLARAGSLPPFINLGQTVERSEIAAVLNHLLRCWAATPVARHGQRQHFDAELTVVPGLVENSRWLERMMASGSIAVAPPPVATHWLACDASQTGCGAIVPEIPEDWVAVGALVGLHNPSEASFRMAVIRRIISEGHHQDHVGLEFIGDSAAPVALFPAAATHAADPARPGEAAILVSRRPDARGRIELIGRHDGIGQTSHLQMRFRDRVHKIALVEVLEDSRHYRRVSYQLV